MGRTGTLVELIDAGRGARVQFGAVTAEVETQDLAPARASEPAPRSAAHPAAPRPRARGQGRPTRAAPGAAAGLATGLATGLAASGAPGAAALGGIPASHEAIPAVFPTSENSLDLRGLRLDDALEQVERFFDASVMKHVSPVILIHGHGTGKLKAGLRDQLRSSRYVAALRPGDAGEGRDGVTVVALNV
jgi:hypothetical protein